SFLIVCSRILITPVSFMLKLLGLAVLAVIVLAPFALFVINAGFMPPRSVVAFPIAVGSLVFLAFLSSWNWSKWVLVFMSFYCAMSFSVMNNRFSFSDHMSWEMDKMLMNQVIIRVNELYGNEHPQADTN